jgi:methyltransferase
MTPLIWILGFVVLQRLAELVWAQRNTRRLLARGGRETNARHYPLFILLHASWLLAIATTVPLDTEPNWLLIGVFAVLQILRLWVITTLGPYWTTRVITLDDAPLVRHGPFRFLRHPNYWIVAGEIAVLPLAFGAWPVALVWSLFNALLLRHRIRIEDEALRPRRTDDPPAASQARSGAAEIDLLL